MIVLDCNAAINMLVGTEEGKALKALLLEGEKVVSPALFCAEVTHVLEKRVRGGHMTREKAREMGRACLSSVDEFIPDGELWEEALLESVRLGHSSYDLFYLLLARRNAATLFTLDRKLQQLCLDNGVNCVFTDTEF
ncbi:type II toxin-antitoxin system VapC family toxin [Arabiibacter massiliensis]|uniref:type II toxin-antitoxin system VapC family toxin n=1 Tax=Arabiibacter massiliensis TaxID=1870985 RepID=UPI0009BA9F3F|nr:type II toxin-antitoxin system VapC family toxin [Arabiibacter massiliensis]